MLEQLAFLHLKQSVAHDLNVHAGVLTRLALSRQAQRALTGSLVVGDEIAVSERQRVLERQEADLDYHLKRLAVQGQPTATPYMQYLRTAVGDGSTLSSAEKLVFIDFTQAETISLLDVLIEALHRKPETIELLSRMRGEESLWQRWVRSRPEFTTCGPAVRTRFERLFTEARLHAATVLLREGLLKHF